MLNSIRTSYLYHLLNLTSVQSISKKVWRTTYFFLVLLFVTPFHHIAADKKAKQSSKTNKKSQPAKRKKKHKKTSRLKPNIRVRVKKPSENSDQVKATSSDQLMPSTYSYIDTVINDEFIPSLSNTKDETEARIGNLGKIVHASFYRVWRKNVEKSLNKSIPLLWDEHTRRSLSIFIGPRKNQSENIINKVANILHQGANPMIRYMVTVDFIRANKDISRMRYQSRQLNALQKNAEVTYGLNDLIGTYYVAIFHACTHLASDQIPLYFFESMQMFQGDSIQKFTNSAILLSLEKQIGGHASKAAKKNPWTSLLFRILLIELGWVEALYRLRSLVLEGKKWLAIMGNFRSSFRYQFSYKREDLSRYNPKRHPTPLGYTYPFIAIKSITWFMGGENIAWALTAPLHLMLNFVQEFIPGSVPIYLDRLWEFCKRVYYNCKRLLFVTNGLINLLHGMRDTLTLIKKVKKILEDNPDLKRTFVAEYAKIRRFVRLKKTKNFRTLLASVQKIRKTPVSIYFILKPWKTLPTRLMALYTKILEEPDEVNELFREALFASLQVLYAAVKTKAVLLSSGPETPYPVCIAHIEEAENPAVTEKEATTQKPSVQFTAMYTPMLYGASTNIVKNDIEVGGEYKHAILMGPNGSGKSVCLKGSGINIVASEGMGIGFASSIHIKVAPQLLIFDANASDSIIAKRSLFQEEAIRYEQLLEVIKQYKLSAWVIFDEKLGSTIPTEAVYLLTSMLSVLDQQEGTSMFISSHFREMYRVFQEMKLNQFKFMSTEYRKGEGFTFKVKDGASKQPSAVYTLIDMNFHQETFDRFIKMLHQDPTYQFKHKLPGYKKVKQKKRMSKALRFLLYLMLILSLLGFSVFFFRRFKITMKLEDRKKKDS